MTPTAKTRTPPHDRLDARATAAGNARTGLIDRVILLCREI
jgi:hypothetical protein